MPGSVGNPVRFRNPFRRITEVGWPGQYIAIKIALQAGPSSLFTGAACSPREQTITSLETGISPTPWTNRSIQTLASGYWPGYPSSSAPSLGGTPPDDEDKILSAHRYSGGAWASLAWADYEITGIPAGGSEGFAQWEGMLNGAGGYRGEIVAAGFSSAVDVEVPTGTGQFDEGLGFSIKYDGNAPSGGPVCTEIFGNPGVFTEHHLGTTDNATEIGSFLFATASMEIIHNDWRYTPVATKKIDSNSIWILFQIDGRAATA